MLTFLGLGDIEGPQLQTILRKRLRDPFNCYIALTKGDLLSAAAAPFSRSK